MHRLVGLVEEVKDRILAAAGGAHARTWLLVLAFLEAFIFPVSIELLLIPVVMGQPKERWINIALLTTIASVLGGLAGYVLGLFFFETIGSWIVVKLHLGDAMTQLSQAVEKNAFGAVLTTALTPIPYMAGTISAGVFKVNLAIFIGACVLGRSIRIFLVSWFVQKFGHQMTKLALKYFNIASIVVVILIAAYIYLKVSMH